MLLGRLSTMVSDLPFSLLIAIAFSAYFIEKCQVRWKAWPDKHIWKAGVGGR